MKMRLRYWFLVLVLVLAASVISKADCIGSQAHQVVSYDAGLTQRIAGATADIERKIAGVWTLQQTVTSSANGVFSYYGDECGEYRAKNIQVPSAFQPCTLNQKFSTWNWTELGYPVQWYVSGELFYCLEG